MTSMRKINSLMHLKCAREAACCGDTELWLTSLTKAFYLRCTAEDEIDIEFSSFFTYQFKVFLMGRKDFLISLEEGDEVCQLIRDTFSEMKISLAASPFDTSASGEWNLLKALKIDFRDKKTPFLTA